jgi:hypothetical protein
MEHGPDAEGRRGDDGSVTPQDAAPARGEEGGREKVKRNTRVGSDRVTLSLKVHYVIRIDAMIL